MARGDAGKTKVAIVGGGMAGLTAAFELSRPRLDPRITREKYLEHTDRYDITVYQMGWRLGGKGASGRNLEHADRIEEHGLHVWMGFYENAFRMIRQCYAELTDRATHPDKYPDAKPPPKPAFETWTDAFFPDSLVGVAEERGDGTWGSWTGMFPPTAGLPGDKLDDQNNPYTLQSYLTRALGLVRTLILSVLSKSASDEVQGRKRSDLDRALDEGKLEFSQLSPRLIVDTVTRMLRVGVLSSAAGLLQAVLILEVMLKARNSIPGNDYKILEFIDAIASNTRHQLEDVVKIDPRLRRKTEIIDLVMTCIVGILADDLLAGPNGLDAIDHLDAREWLTKHGATRSSLDSPIMKGLYDMAFADVEVGGKQHGLSAGQALRCTLRMFFTYRGALFWRMRSSMGEVVFAPMYDLLRARGVKFEFFHRLEAIHVNWGKPDNPDPFIERLDFDVQAQVRRASRQSKEEAVTYKPLVEIKGAGGRTLRAWPSAPDFGQLRDGPRLKRAGCSFESLWDQRTEDKVSKTVADGDFELVVLAVGLGAIPYLGGNLIQVTGESEDRKRRRTKTGPNEYEYETVRRWTDMLKHMKTVATQGAQVWLSKDLCGLGWNEPPITLTAFAKPFDTWSDMTHIVPVEQWRTTIDEDHRQLSPPSTLAYFCGALPELEPPEPAAVRTAKTSDEGMKSLRTADQKTLATVKGRVIELLDSQIGNLWPGATRNDVAGHARFDWSLLVDGRSARKTSGDKTPFDSQFWTASLHPSDRYVLSVPGSAAYRISPLDDTYANLIVAGDWTSCGFIGGCVEAAVMSGMLAAHAVCGKPELHEIVGYDHP